MKHLMFLFGLIISFSAQAAETTIAKIHQGDGEANANFKVDRFLDGFWGRNKNVGGSLQYFIWDGFSGGVELNYFSYYGGYKGGSVAPIFTKYLFAGGHWAPYVSLLPVRFISEYREPLKYSTSARVGLKYFLNEHIAVGPAFDYTKAWRLDSVRDLSLTGTVSYHF